MDEFIKSLVMQAPNLAVAIAVLYWQRKTIDQLVANQTALIDKLLEFVDSERQHQADQSRLKSDSVP